MRLGLRWKWTHILVHRCASEDFSFYADWAVPTRNSGLLGRSPHGRRSIWLCALIVMLAVPLGCSQSSCDVHGGLRLRVDRTTYAVAAQADAIPHEAAKAAGLVRTRFLAGKADPVQYCQSADVAVIETLRFSFRLTGGTSPGGSSAQTITRADALIPAVRPTFPPIASASILRVWTTPLRLDRAAASAAFDLHLHERGGSTRQVPVQCLSARKSLGLKGTTLSHCQFVLPLAGGNLLDMVVSPPNGNLDYVGAHLIRALRDAETFKKV